MTIAGRLPSTKRPLYPLHQLRKGASSPLWRGVSFLGREEPGASSIDLPDFDVTYVRQGAAAVAAVEESLRTGAPFQSVFLEIGGWTARARFEYAPTQQNLGDESVYAALEAERPIGETGFALMGSIGWESGAFTLDGEKWDYLVGGRYWFESASLDLTYVDTDEDAQPGEKSAHDGCLALAVKAEFC